ncbi:receptor-type guanylate cyclase gcy-5-like [Daphnia pulex]|uniref:receptor-type guanylate cyclase gcy-5-like n=1 Tax=Daphnia pulex TaxID=6669 RepID=UPI001EDEE1F2|nr:receptor-type guanylate cyclase gcy-5-like [Daphnia pulex]XP_046448260.1 receptor-type guanylate cyclase gcy-5-like [Daphnia pulex]
MAIKVSSAMTLHVMLHTAMIAASMTSTVSSVQVEGSFSTPSTSKCLTDDQLAAVGLNMAQKPARSFLHDNKALELRLEASDRVTHQLSTAVFAIFIREVLGYRNVTVTKRRDAFNVSAVLSRMAGCSNPINCDSAELQSESFVPETMINLEVWVPLGYNMEQWSASGNLEECGLLGPGGRFGWFMPQWTINSIPLPDHWRSLLDPEIATRFDVDAQEMRRLAEFTKDPTTGRYYCDASYCDKGIFYPEYCREDEFGNMPPCAVLLAEYPDYMSFLIKQIPSLGLRVKVVWLGPNADRVVRDFFNDVGRRLSGRSIMFFAWRPSTITESAEFLSVSFPQCETLSTPDSDMRCAYEFQRFEKVAWTYLKKGAKLVFEALQRVFFTQEEYNAMLHLYNERPEKEPLVEEIACDWMKRNPDVWSQWKPSDLTVKMELYIGGIFPISGPFYKSGPGMVPAAQMAVDAINRNGTILRDYELKLLVADGQCSADMVMKSFIDYLRFKSFNRMVGILGPACSDTVEPVAGVSKRFKTIAISYSAQGSSFADRNKFPYFFRTIGETGQFKYVFLTLLQQLGWKRVGALMSDGKKYSDYVNTVQDYAESNKITFVTTRKITSISSLEYLKDLKAKRVKIIVGEFDEERACEVMCQAFRLNMTAKEGYVWFLPNFNSELFQGPTPIWYDIDSRVSQSNRTLEAIPCSTEQIIQAIDGHFYMTYSSYAPNESLMQEGVNVSNWRRRYEFQCARFNTSTSEYASYIYDSVWTYALALDKLLAGNESLAADFHTDHTTESLRRIINETDFTGVSGRVRFTGALSRYSDIQVFQWINKSSELIGRFLPVARTKLTKPTSGPPNLNKSLIKWLTWDGKQPVDDPEPGTTVCVLDGLANLLNVECEAAIVVANILGFGVFAGCLVVFFFVFKRRYERKVEQTEERMRALGLLSSGTLLTLDEWEIPRERIVINRKLGEGAFGTVYGGEAFFDDKGWVAVAVKTLKVGSTVEEKLDFLSEAEMMKRFNHKNIVRLLGVCTRNEPVYTVMEFILYGDLKTYLLARRHLVYEKSREDSDEISGRRLTSIALDVAKALSYLAELKYVHRDVACRNCLVNSNRVAKLADFGMARPMYENDYYRFHRKGMLPVRWMAPESLVDGLFTPMTDIWSYGVLLYEIITFGSFPFQGMSNNQVLGHIKNGMTIDIPEGVKPQLETLLKSCWHRTPSLRPQAAEVVELLTNNTRLIQPCVGIPLSSIQIEGSASLELQLPAAVTVHGCQVRKSNSGGNNKLGSSSLASKLASLDLSLGSGGGSANNSDSLLCDPLLMNPYPASHFVTQYITLQHRTSGEQIYIAETRENGSSQV